MAVKIHLIRPPKKIVWDELYRYADGEWIPDDGEKDVAFGGKTTGNIPYAYGYDLPYNIKRAEHPNEVAYQAAMKFVSGKYRCANGRRVKK